MALPASGAISFADINVELGVSSTTTRSLNETAVRTLFGQASGAVDMNTGHGKANAFTVNLTITTNTKNYNIRTAAIAAGWNGTVALITTVTINSGVRVGSSSTATYAMDTGAIPTGSTVSIINNGYIVGKGGTGGNNNVNLQTRQAGFAGGPALLLQCAVNITNATGYIYTGGGGGGSGGTYGGSYVGGGGGGGAGSSVGLAGYCIMTNGAFAYYGVNGGISAGGRGANGAITQGGAAGGALNVAGGNGAYAGGGGGGGGGANGGAGHYSGGVAGAGGGHGVAITGISFVSWVSGNTRVYGGTA